MLEDHQAEPPRTRRTLVVVVVVAVLALASLVAYLQIGYQHRTTSVLPPVGTTTNTITYPCPTSFTTQTTTTSCTANNTSTRGLDFGPLLDNFSAMTVVLYGNGSNGRSLTSSNMAVLSRSSAPSGPLYEVNVTTESIEPQVTISSYGNTTTTITSPGNVTRIGSVLADLAKNGSVVSMIRSSGNLSGLLLPLWLFVPLLSQNYSSSNSRTIGTSTVTIGTTRMSVTNLEFPDLVNLIIQEGCSGQQATTTKETISHWEVQVGQVPGTTFTLLTRYSQIFSIQSNSTSTEFSITEEVTGFTIA